MPRCPIRSRRLAALVGLAVVTAPVPAPAAMLVQVTNDPSPATTRDPSAVAAHADAQGLMRSGDYSEAVVRLDLAVDLEPQWSAPLLLRAEAFGKLAERYRPGAAFLSAQAADLERLQSIEPGVDATARAQRIAALREQAREARKVEQRRRDLTKPAILTITASALAMVSGGLMLGFTPSTTIDAYRQRTYIYTGATMLAVGVALAVPAITLGVLSGRQGKRDSALNDFNVRTDSRHAHLGLAPQVVSGGGGMALRLRF